jgi:hypothetical protein
MVKNRFLFPVLGLFYYEFRWYRRPSGELVFTSVLDGEEVV